MHEAVKAAPAFLQGIDNRFNLIVLGDVHFKADIAAEFIGKFRDAIAEALAHVREGELGAFTMTGAGDAVRNRAVGQNARDQKFLALQKAHG